MEIIINDKTRLRVTSEYYAPMKLIPDKEEKSGYRWKEHRWFTDLPQLIKYLTQKTLSEKNVTVSLGEFLKLYEQTSREIIEVLESDGVS